MAQFIIVESVVSNACDSFRNIYGHYETEEEALRNIPEDHHDQEGDSWWDYSYFIEEEE